MPTREPGDLRRLGDLLGDTYADLAGQGGDRQAHGGSSPAEPERMLALVWHEIVGAEVAANAQPVQLRRKRLVVSSASSAWAQTLQFMGPAIKTSINERLGAQVVDEVVFRHAGWKGGRPDAPALGEPAGEAAGEAATAPLSAEQEAAVAEVETLDLTPELRERIVRAMKAAFVRGERPSVR